MELSSEILSNVQHFSVLSFDDNLYEDEQTLQEASSLLGVLQDNIAKLDSILRVPRNKALLSELNNDTREYDQAMTAMVAAQRSRQQHIADSLEFGSSSDRLIASLNERVNGSLTSPAMHETYIRAMIGRAVAELLESRRTLAYEARGVLLFGAAALPAVEAAR